MHHHTRKLQLIEDILHLDDESVLAQVETIIHRGDSGTDAPYDDITGIWSNEVGEVVEKAIKESEEYLVDLYNWK